MIANTPSPPYYTVIFTSVSSENQEGYHEMSEKMLQLAKKQKGFLGVESARNELGITVSYWDGLEAIKDWKLQADHTEARKKGRSTWYSAFKIRVAKVERDYEFIKQAE